MNQQKFNPQEEYEGSIDNMIEQEIARIHGLNYAKTANMIVKAASAEETADMMVSSNTNSKKNYKKTDGAITANNLTNQQNKQNNR